MMLGCRNGLAVKLKGDIPHLVEIHCVAHRLELASVAAIKGIKQVQDIRDLLKGLSKQYHYSPKALRELKAVAEALCVKPFRPGNLSGTRWMDHFRKALECLLRDHSSMLAHCEHCVTDKSSSPEMLGRAKQVNTTLTTWPSLLSMFPLRDVFEELSILSLVFQANSTTLSIVMQALETACLNLVAMRELPAKHLAGFLEAVGEGDQYKGHTLKRRNDAALATFLQQKRHLIDLMLKYLDQRFKDFQSRPVLAAAQILNIREWPDTVEDLATFGNESLTYLSQHFRTLLTANNCEVDQLQHEWQQVKVFTRRQAVSNPTQHPHAIWKKVLTSEIDGSENIGHIIEMIMVLPLSTAVVERGFSAMSRIKSDWRANLHTATLRKLMLIAMEGVAASEFKADGAVRRWWRSADRGGRRPDFGH